MIQGAFTSDDAVDTEGTAAETHYTYFPSTAVGDGAAGSTSGSTAAVVTTQGSEALLGQATPPGTGEMPGEGGCCRGGGARAGGEACGQAVAFAHVPWPSPRPGPGWGRHRLSRRRRSPFLEGALRPRPQLGEVPTPVSLPRSVLCDDVATRSVARRKPALHRPQDSPLLAVSNPRVFSVTASGLQPRHVSCDSSPRTPVSFCLGLHWQEVRSAADDSG